MSKYPIPSEAKFIEQTICREVFTPEAARQAFYNATTRQQVSRLMTCVVIGKIPSPIYQFEPVEEENTDNDWWGSPAWELLVAMNLKGFITVESESGGNFVLPDEMGGRSIGTDPYSSGGVKLTKQLKQKITPKEAKSRSSVDGILPRDKAQVFVHKMNSLGFVAWGCALSVNVDRRDIVPVTRTMGPDGRRLSFLPFCYRQFVSFQDVLNKKLFEYFMNNEMSVTVFDPVFGREGVVALFPAIVGAL